jgi:hypothetical protein
MIRRLIGRFAREEDGFVLVLAIASVSILAITTTGIILAGTANESTAYFSSKERAAFAVAQQALAYGEGMVYSDVQGSPSTTPPTATQNLPTQPDGATGTYRVSTSNGTTWTVYASGTVGSVTRSVSVQVTPSQSVTTSSSTAIWDYGIYENDPVGSLTNCTVAGGTVVSQPIYSKGSFCLAGTTSRIFNSLQVGGKLLLQGNPQIGSPASPIPMLRVVGGCNVLGMSYVTAGVTPCDGITSPVYATSVGTTLGTVPPFPTVDWAGAYATQQALSKSPNCTSGGGACCPPNLFDNNTTLDNSDMSIGSAMFPSYSYQCTVGTYTINWTPAASGPSSLAVNGTFYFDGSLSSSKTIQYTGKASMYFTGGVTWTSASGAFCAVTNCANTWGISQSDPLIVMVADCVGISLATNCVSLSGNGHFQIYFYLTGNYNVSGSTTNMGHVLCWDAVISGGSGITTSFSDLPIGTPTSTGTTFVPGTPPTNWSG